MSPWEKIKKGKTMEDTDYGPYVVLATNHDQHWVVMANCDPDEKQRALNIAQGYLLTMPRGQVAVAQIVAYDTKYPPRSEQSHQALEE